MVRWGTAIPGLGLTTRAGSNENGRIQSDTRTSSGDDRIELRLQNGRPDGILTRISGLKPRNPVRLDDKAEKMKRTAGLAV